MMFFYQIGYNFILLLSKKLLIIQRILMPHHNLSAPNHKNKFAYLQLMYLGNNPEIGDLVLYLFFSHMK